MSDTKVNLDNIWPQERDYISSPERLKYLRRVVKPNDSECVFCSAHENGPSLDSLVVYKNNSAMLVLNKYPYNSGHVLVIPQKHIGDITELSDDEYIELNELLRESIKAAKKIYKCEGLNIGMNHGKVAGAGIPNHLHWHIIPRWSGDTNFFPLIAETKLIPEDLGQTYAGYKKYFDELKGE